MSVKWQDTRRIFCSFVLDLCLDIEILTSNTVTGVFDAKEGAKRNGLSVGGNAGTNGRVDMVGVSRYVSISAQVSRVL